MVAQKCTQLLREQYKADASLVASNGKTADSIKSEREAEERKELFEDDNDAGGVNSV